MMIPFDSSEPSILMEKVDFDFAVKIMSKKT